jgi:signal transduction histidine kinase
MLIDNTGNLWFTNILNQVGRLNTALGTFTTLSDAEGFQKQDYTWSAPAAKDAQGNLYFGGGILVAESGGMHRILPERYLFADIPDVYLRSLTINQKPISLATGVNNLEELSLRYNQNTISIETGIIDFYSKGKGQLRYKLEGNGKDENWQYGPAYYTLRYEGLPPGSYRLVMQASNSGNEFNTPEKILTIIISPPFWQTWWFRILAAVFLIAIVYAIIQYRSRNLKQQNIMLEEKVMVRTRELKHSLEDLKATQTQLIQSEKMASLGELTAGIAHEIQNPLNFVNNFSDVNSELLQELKNEIQADNKQEALLLSDDIATNEQKINHHGKRAEAIVKGMLQHSHNNTGQKEPSDINKLADEYLRLCYNSFRAKDKLFNATIKTDFDYTIAKINIIPQEIGRVILNLLNNAFYSVAEKKKEQGESFEPIVLISTKKIGGKIEIKITDNGKGILQKILDKIFQPFFTTKPTGQGTGLGLSLAYDIITKGHGGELKAETKEGEGSEFIILLNA